MSVVEARGQLRHVPEWPPVHALVHAEQRGGGHTAGPSPRRSPSP